MKIQNLFESIPIELRDFLLVTVLSLLIGLSQRKVKMRNESEPFFGSDRTFTLIGILGYVLYIVQPTSLLLYFGGGTFLCILLAINYFYKITQLQKYGITTFVIAILTYSLAPLVVTQPSWLYLLLVVVILLIVEMKEAFIGFAKKIDSHEFITLSKFLLISVIILPILPKDQFYDGLNLSFYNIWLATVIISAMSYFSYLLKRFVFRNSGVVMSGILGGIYSSTATVIILAKKSRKDTHHHNQYFMGIFLAVAMMYVRVAGLIAIFNLPLFIQVWYYFLMLIAVTFIIAYGVKYYYTFIHHTPENIDIAEEELEDNNPLEFKVSLIFALLFVAFTLITYFTITYFGVKGLNLLSLVVGVTDITPFLITLFQGGYQIDTSTIILATFTAIISNNVVKMLYGISFSGGKLWKPLVIGFTILVGFNLVLLLFV